MPEDQKGYGKRPLWQWIVIYVIVGGVVYGLVYYFFFASRGGTNYGASNANNNYGMQTAPQNTYSPDSNQTVQSAPSPAPSSAVRIAIQNFAFSPNQTTVKVGTKVTWTNNDSVVHTVTSNNGAFDSGALSPGASYSFIFNTAGTYSYHCTIHPMMKASVVVTQ